MGPQQRPHLLSLAPEALPRGGGAGLLPSFEVPLQQQDLKPGSPESAGSRGEGLSHPGYRVTEQGGASWFTWRGVGWIGGCGTSPLSPGRGLLPSLPAGSDSY